MNEATTCILLVPVPEYEERLIGDGIGGAQAPVAFTGRDAPEGCWDLDASWRRMEGGYEEYCDARGLILAWDGEPVADGIARLLLAWLRAEPERDVPWCPADMVEIEHVLLMVRTRAGSPRLLGRLVFLDAEHREVES